jgi:hypothetical protein
MKNHREVIAALDFFTVPTANFRMQYVLLVIPHGRRDIAHWNLTEHPSARRGRARRVTGADTRSRGASSRAR